MSSRVLKKYDEEDEQKKTSSDLKDFSDMIPDTSAILEKIDRSVARTKHVTRDTRRDWSNEARRCGC